MTNIENYTALAKELGGTFIPAKWREDEPASEDRGYIVFGDPADWRTPRLFIHPPYNSTSYAVLPVHNLKYGMPDGTTRENSKYSLSINTDSVKVGRTRAPAAAAKDIKRRLLDPFLLEHPGAVAKVEAQMTKDDETAAWKIKMGLDPARESGRVWSRTKNYSGPSAELRVGYQCDLTISSLSRDQAERIVEFLNKEM